MFHTKFCTLCPEAHLERIAQPSSASLGFRPGKPDHPLQVKSFIQGKIDEVQGQERELDNQEIMLFWQFAQLALNAKSDVFAPGVTSSKDGSAGDTACP